MIYLSLMHCVKNVLVVVIFLFFFSKCLRNCGRCLVLLYIVKTLINGSRYRRKIHVFPSFCSPNCSSIYTILLIISYPETYFNLHVLWSQYDKHTHNVPVDLCKFYLAFFFFFHWITGSFSDSDICGGNLCQHSGGLGISMDYAEKESKETLTQEKVSDWLNWNLLSLTVIIFIILIFQDLGSKA